MTLRSVTIDRQYGSGGREVGKLVAKQLRLPFYDGQLLELTAEKSGLNSGAMKAFDEKRSGSLLHDIALFAGSVQSMEKVTKPYEIFEAQSQTIRRLASAGPSVFIGRCADAALKDHVRALNVFIYASSMEERKARIKDVDHVDIRKLETYIKKKDMERREYCKFFGEREWGKVENYDLCLNTTTLGYDGCARIIGAVLNG